MYRNIYYDNYKSSIHLWGWNEEGERTYTQIPYSPHLYLESKTETEYKSIYNTNLRKIEFKNTWERNKYIKQYRLERIFYNLRPEMQFLIDQFASMNNSTEFTKYDLDVCFIDIEVYTCKAPLQTKITCKRGEDKYTLTILDLLDEDKKGLLVWDEEIDDWISFESSSYTQTLEFPDAIDAKYPINVITLYSTLHRKFFTWGLKGHYKSARDNVVYTRCDTEVDLLRSFLKYWTNNYPDVLSSWNGEQFDVPYVINRITNILGENSAKTLSPVKSIFYKEGISSVFGRDVGKWTIHGMSCIDYMDAYKKFSRGESSSYSLNYIAMKELGEGKIKFNATDLSKLAITDWQTFIDYNIQDVNILVELENKLRYISLIRMIAYKGLANLESAMGTISVVTGTFAQKALEQGMIIPTFAHKSREHFEGGFVRPPVRGMQSDVISFDANSLYPNTIITLNISPETKLGKIVKKDTDTITLELVDGERRVLTHEKFAAFVRKTDACISKARVLYSQKTKGFIPQALDNIYNERLEYRKQLKAARKYNSRIDKVLKAKTKEIK